MTGSGSEFVLALDGVSKSYRAAGHSVTALQRVTFGVHAHEVVGVIGESGAGKSTIARLLLGLEAPSEGRVTLQGADVSARRSRAQRRVVQMVFQDPRSSLNPRMSILQSVEDFAVVHRLGGRRERRARAEAALARVGIASRMASRRPAELSGGQLQRACIARALVTDPLALVADEPTSSLDVSIQGEILNLIDGLRREMAIVLISHDMDVVEFLSDRVHVLLDGEIVESGPVTDVCRSPSHEYSRRLLGARRALFER